MSQVVLVVDDDPVQRRLVEAMVQRFGYEVLTADSGDAALALLTGGTPIDAVVLDLVMPDLDGLGVLARLREAGVGTPVIVQTAHGGIDNVVSAMRAGAADFVVKPVGPERLQVSLRNALAAKALAGELQRIKRKQDGTLTINDVISRSPAMQPVLRAVEKAAASIIPVLIEGESGVGKELIARAIHGSGARRAKPFVAVNCGALPETLVESILFGHEKGAFTGATEKHTGKFVEADGGTLFLDEVGELPLPAQVKLLRALQEGEVEPVGGRKSVKVDVRIVSATNRDLIADVKAGRFREDLFYRLHVFPVSVPPLRRRPEDVPELTRHFLTRIAAEEGKRVRAITGEALSMLSRYRWPGNVRQLENTVFRAVVLADGEEVGVDEFPQIAAQIDDDNATTVQPALEPVTALIDPWAAREASLAPAERQSLAGMGPTLRLTDTRGDVRPLEDIESEVIRFALSHYRGQMSEVARRLKIGRSTLYRKLEELELDGKSAAAKVNGTIDAA
ncbi:sigma-54 dependent transcriptional regulator [Microbacteriaceae bacterium K1510]|nr:sigma-54 dependent transcriptional regulator [Microbacteriaceae bacterium K1510]